MLFLKLWIGLAILFFLARIFLTYLVAGYWNLNWETAAATAVVPLIQALALWAVLRWQRRRR